MDDEKTREVKARQTAERRHLWLRKTRTGRHVPCYVLVDMASSRVVEGPFSLEQLENWLLDEQETWA